MRRLKKSAQTSMKLLIALLLLAVSSQAIGKTARAYLMTTSTSINESELHIINLSTSSQRFRGTLFEGSGARLGSSNQLLHSGAVRPGGRLILSSRQLENLFGVPPWRGPAMLEVQADSNFRVMIKLRSPSGFVSNSNCVTTGEVHNVEGFEQSDRTFIRFINTGDTAISNIEGALFTSDGTPIGGGLRPLLSSLAPKAQVWITNTELRTIFGRDWTGPATLAVSQHTNLRLLNLNFVNDETFFNFSCIEEGTVVTTTDQNIWQRSLAGTWIVDPHNSFTDPSPGCAGLEVTATANSSGSFSFQFVRRSTGVSASIPSLGIPLPGSEISGLLFPAFFADTFTGHGITISGFFTPDDPPIFAALAVESNNCAHVLAMEKR